MIQHKYPLDHSIQVEMTAQHYVMGEVIASASSDSGHFGGCGANVSGLYRYIYIYMNMIRYVYIYT